MFLVFDDEFTLYSVLPLQIFCFQIVTEPYLTMRDEVQSATNRKSCQANPPYSAVAQFGLGQVLRSVVFPY
jgi:hypothetical protein